MGPAGQPRLGLCRYSALFKRLETRLGKGDPLYRGQSGEQVITDLEWRHPLCEAFVQAALDMGMPVNADYNGRTQEGVTYVQRTAKGRFRYSAARAFLKPVKARPNLHIITNAHTTSVQVEAGRATGVTFSKGGGMALNSKFWPAVR